MKTTLLAIDRTAFAAHGRMVSALLLATAAIACQAPEVAGPKRASAAGMASAAIRSAHVWAGGPAEPPPPAPPPPAPPPPAPSPDKATPPTEDPSARGAKVYAAQCASCHGPAAEGTALAFGIRTPPAGLARWVIRNGRKGGGFAAAMPAYGADVLPDADLDALLGWLQSFDKPKTGEGLFRQLCSNCHGTDGSGGVVGENVAREAQHEPDEVLRRVRKGHGGQNYAKRKAYMPAFSKQQLSDAEVGSIVSWLRGLPKKAATKP